RQLDTRRLGVRLVGVTASRFQPMVHQPSLFDAPAERRRRRLYAGVDTIRERYGFAAISAASRI
ncbi:MAG TPA: DNA polymerase IV, partial [Acidobacteriota bacterium]|nr:DNA polymerase IV [Acidobacteriota bacterium]